MSNTIDFKALDQKLLMEFPEAVVEHILRWRAEFLRAEIAIRQARLRRVHERYSCVEFG